MKEKVIVKHEAIDILEKMKRKKEECNCGRRASADAIALGYAIMVLKKIKEYEVELSK